MSLLLQVSDTHFGTEQPNVLEALVWLARQQAPELVVLSGDITQRARRAQFRSARTFVDRLGAPHLLALPGNHDIPLFNLIARVFFPYSNHQRAFGLDLEPSFESAELLVVSANTTRPWRHKDGEISRAQIERVSKRLRKAAPRQLRIVVTHQPVYVTRKSEEKNLLHGHREAIVAWAEAGADLVIGGHIHLPYVRPLREHFPELTRNVWVAQAGTAVSNRVRHDAPNSVNLIRYARSDPDCRYVVERWDYKAGQDEFAVVERTEIKLDRSHVPSNSCQRRPSKDNS